MKRILIYTLAAIPLFSACNKENEEARIIPEMVQQIQTADKMVFASMSITKTAKTERTDWYKVGKRIAVYSYDSYLQAYIDLSQFSADDLRFDDRNHTLTITLPPIQTEVAGRDMQLRKEYENIGVFRTNIDSKERAEIKERANAQFVKEVEKNPKFRRQLTEAAQRKARAWFEALADSYGYTATVNFK